MVMDPIARLMARADADRGQESPRLGWWSGANPRSAIEQGGRQQAFFKILVGVIQG